MEKIKLSEKVTNEQVLDGIGEKRKLINNILCRKVNLIGQILRTNCLLHESLKDRSEANKYKEEEHNFLMI